MNPNNSGENLPLPNFVGVKIDRVRDHVNALPQKLSIQVRYEDSETPRGTVLAQSLRTHSGESADAPVLELTVAEESWMRFLPAFYKSQDTEQLGEQFLFLLQERYEKTQGQLEKLSRSINPIHCSSKNLYRMADLSGRDYLRQWPELRARRLMSQRHDLDRWRHTRKGLKFLLSQLLVNWSWSLEESNSPGPLRLGQSRLGQERLEVKSKPSVIVWLNHSEADFGEDRTRALRRTLECERVAGTSFALRFLVPTQGSVNPEDI